MIQSNSLVQELVYKSSFKIGLKCFSDVSSLVVFQVDCFQIFTAFQSYK